MLYLRLDQLLRLLAACETMREKLVIRYFGFNGLSPMELANARIEHLDPVECTLFLPKRHWKKNCQTDIDAETVRLTIIYCGDRKRGPLIQSRYGGHFRSKGLLRLVKRVARRTIIRDRHKISALILKRTFAKLFLKTPGNTIGGLQKQFSHKHLWSTAHYLRFDMDDVREEHDAMMRQIENAKRKPVELTTRS